MDLLKRIQDLSAIYDDFGPSATVQESRPMFNNGGRLGFEPGGKAELVPGMRYDNLPDSTQNKIRSLGDDTLATQDKTISKKYKDYVMEEDFAGNIEIIKKGDDVAEDVFMSYKVDEVPLKKGGSRKVEEYEEYTARPDMEGKMKDIEPGVPDNVIEEAMSEAPSIRIKKASGGIARMLGE